MVEHESQLPDRTRHAASHFKFQTPRMPSQQSILRCSMLPAAPQRAVGRLTLLVFSMGLAVFVCALEAPGRSAEWYAVYGSGISHTADNLNNTGWAIANRESLTGYSTCCGCWGVSSSGAFELNPQRLDGGGTSLCGGSSFADVVSMGVSVIPAGGLDSSALLSGAWKAQGAPAAAAAAVRENGWNGLEIDVEWQDPPLELLQAFKDFVGELALALADCGAIVVLDTNALWTGQIGQVLLIHYTRHLLLNNQ